MAYNKKKKSGIASKVAEMCPHCMEEVELDPIPFEPQACPNCGGPIKACSLCDHDVCDCAKCRRKHKEGLWFRSVEDAKSHALAYMDEGEGRLVGIKGFDGKVFLSQCGWPVDDAIDNALLDLSCSLASKFLGSSAKAEMMDGLVLGLKDEILGFLEKCGFQEVRAIEKADAQ